MWVGSRLFTFTWPIAAYNNAGNMLFFVSHRGGPFYTLTLPCFVFLSIYPAHVHIACFGFEVCCFNPDPHMLQQTHPNSHEAWSSYRPRRRPSMKASLTGSHKDDSKVRSRHPFGSLKPEHDCSPTHPQRVGTSPAVIQFCNARTKLS